MEHAAFLSFGSMAFAVVVTSCGPTSPASITGLVSSSDARRFLVLASPLRCHEGRRFRCAPWGVRGSWSASYAKTQNLAGGCPDNILKSLVMALPVMARPDGGPFGCFFDGHAFARGPSQPSASRSVERRLPQCVFFATATFVAGLAAAFRAGLALGVTLAVALAFWPAPRGAAAHANFSPFSSKLQPPGHA